MYTCTAHSSYRLQGHHIVVDSVIGCSVQWECAIKQPSPPVANRGCFLLQALTLYLKLLLTFKEHACMCESPILMHLTRKKIYTGIFYVTILFQRCGHTSNISKPISNISLNLNLCVSSFVYERQFQLAVVFPNVIICGTATDTVYFAVRILCFKSNPNPQMN